LQGHAFIGMQQLDPTITALNNSLTYRASIDVLVLKAAVFLSAGLFDEALNVIDEARQFENSKKYPVSAVLEQINTLEKTAIKLQKH